MLPLRKALRLHEYITDDHFESIAKILLFTSLIVSYAYIVEFGLASYGGNLFETESFRYRVLGDFRYLTWAMIFCNSLVPLTLFARRLRRNTGVSARRIPAGERRDVAGAVRDHRHVAGA